MCKYRKEWNIKYIFLYAMGFFNYEVSYRGQLVNKFVIE